MSNFFGALGFESRQLIRRGNLRSYLVTLLVLAAFGVLVPWMKGFEFLDTRFVLAYCSIGLLFSGPLMAEMLLADGTAVPPAMVYFARVALVSLYGWLISVLMLVLGFGVVNLRHWYGKILLPATPVLISALGLGLLASIFVAEFTAIVTLKFSAGAAKIGLRLMFFGVLALIVFGPESVSDSISRSMTTENLPALALKLAAGLVVVNTALLFALPGARKPEEPKVSIVEE